jgi:D-alanine-D-alanine ligase
MMSHVAEPNLFAGIGLPTPAALGRVAVLMGGESAEREISLRSGAGVLAALQGAGVDAFAFDPAQRDLSELSQESVDRAFIALHGRFGEDGTVQGALELMKIPYTGSGVLASSLAMDKPMTKRIWRTHDLPTPMFETLGPDMDPHAVVASLGLPIAVKPASEGSSLGFTRVEETAQLRDAYALARRFDQHVIAECFVSGREFTCALLESSPGHVHALPVIEIVAPAGNYDFQNKYFGDATQYLCPAPISPALEQQMRALSVKAFETLGCSGWARADLMLDIEQGPMLLEINTSPGMTDHSLVPMAAKQAGLSYAQLVMRIAASASLKLEHAQ